MKRSDAILFLLSVCSVCSVGASAGTFIKEWQICGPFDSHSLLTAVVDNEGAVSPAADVAGKAWKKVVSDADIINLASDEACGHHDNVAAFAYAEVEATNETDFLVGLGSDDAIEAWWNGQPVLIHDVLRGTKPDEDQVHVHAKPGKNALLLKVYNEGGGWGFAADYTPVTP